MEKTERNHNRPYAISNSHQTLSVPKSSSPAMKNSSNDLAQINRNRFKWESSNNFFNRVDPSADMYESHNPSANFLTNYASSNSSKFTGLFGVASAAMAASRAGSNIDWSNGKQYSLLEANSDDLKKPISNLEIKLFRRHSDTNLRDLNQQTSYPEESECLTLCPKCHNVVNLKAEVYRKQSSSTTKPLHLSLAILNKELDQGSPSDRSNYKSMTNALQTSEKGQKLAFDALSFDLIRSKGLFHGFPQLKKASDFKSVHRQSSDKRSPRANQSIDSGSILGAKTDSNQNHRGHDSITIPDLEFTPDFGRTDSRKSSLSTNKILNKSKYLTSNIPMLNKHLTRSTTITVSVDQKHSKSYQERESGNPNIDKNYLSDGLDNTHKRFGHASAPGMSRTCTEEEWPNEFNRSEIGNACEQISSGQTQQQQYSLNTEYMTAAKWKRQQTIDCQDSSMNFFHNYRTSMSRSGMKRNSSTLISPTTIQHLQNLEDIHLLSGQTSLTENSNYADDEQGITLVDSGTIDDTFISIPQKKLPAGHHHSHDEELTQANKKTSTNQSDKKLLDNCNFHNLRNVGYRLGKRRELFEQRCRISDYSLIFALFGILLMIIETELVMSKVYTKADVYSKIIKTLISISTFILILLILGYHVLVIKIFSCDDSIEDWRIAIDMKRIVSMSLEVLLCLIHPMPFDVKILWEKLCLCGDNLDGSNTINENNETKIYFNQHSKYCCFNPCDSNSFTDVSIDLFLSLPMFLRLYLIFRVLLLHSKLYTDAGSRSIGAMNKVSFDTRFVLKTYMTTKPATVLLAFIFVMWIILSWTLRLCESVHDDGHNNILNSLWLISVTFLSIGYGDVVPKTYCGRAIAIMAGVMGSSCTAMVVAVFARKLDLSKAEKHVIHFMMENELAKKVKNHAANVLRETWLIYKHTKLVNKVVPAKVRIHQRKFLAAIHGLRQTKIDHRKVQDSANTLVDLAKMQFNIYETVVDMRLEQTYNRRKAEIIEASLGKIQEQVEILTTFLKSQNNSFREHSKSQQHNSAKYTPRYQNQNKPQNIFHTKDAEHESQSYGITTNSCSNSNQTKYNTCDEQELTPIPDQDELVNDSSEGREIKRMTKLLYSDSSKKKRESFRHAKLSPKPLTLN